MKKLLWLDDMRNPFDNDWLRFSPIAEPFECIWVKSYDEFTTWIISNGLSDAICFDHDLGLEIIETSDLLNTSVEEKSGFDCAKWLVNYSLDNNLTLPKWNIQSANPVGKANIDGLFKSFIKNFQS